MTRATPWTPEELRLLGRYVRAYEKGKYDNMMQAAREYSRELDDLRKRHPSWVWLRCRRSAEAARQQLKSMTSVRTHATQPHWTEPEMAVIRRFARALRNGQYPHLRAAARACLPELDTLRLNSPPGRRALKARTLQAVRYRLQTQEPILGRLTSWGRWTGPEEEVIDHYARNLLAGRYPDAPRAAVPCRQELLRRAKARPHEFGRRTRAAVQHRVCVRAAELGRVAHREHWTEAERRVLDGYVRALMRGRFRSVDEAVRVYQQDQQRLRRLHPKARWLAPRRSPGGLHIAIVKRARQLGRARHAKTWLPGETRLIERFAWRVVKGRLPDAAAAAREYSRHVEELRRRYPDELWLRWRRSPRVVRMKIWKRARELGRPQIYFSWTASELVLLRKHARMLVDGEFRNAQDAARTCRAAMEKLDIPQDRPVRRTLIAVHGEVMSQARAMGPQWRSSRWTAQERAILDRHMRDYLAGRFPSLRDTARSVWREFEVQYRRVQHRKPWRERAPLCRNVKMILDKLRRDTLRLGRRPHGRLTPDEERISRKWADRFHASDGSLSRRAAALRMMFELRRHGYARTRERCESRLRIRAEPGS
jgi:hypothetical protein